MAKIVFQLKCVIRVRVFYRWCKNRQRLPLVHRFLAHQKHTTGIFSCFEGRFKRTSLGFSFVSASSLLFTGDPFLWPEGIDTAWSWFGLISSGWLSRRTFWKMIDKRFSRFWFLSVIFTALFPSVEINKKSLVQISNQSLVYSSHQFNDRVNRI